jgi:hypothetical protein
MAQLSNKLVSKLRHLVAALQAFLQEIDAGARGGAAEVRQLPEVAEKIERHECLMCGRNLPGRYKRGLCGRDHVLTMRRIKEGTWNEQERIDLGKLAWPDKPGATAQADKMPPAKPTTLEQDSAKAKADLERGTTAKPHKGKK